MHRHPTFKCPYDECQKPFQKPLALTDSTTIPRETYYVCPHCMSKINIIVENKKHINSVSIKKAENAKEIPPEKCPNYFGYLRSLPDDAPIPDECLTCPKMVACHFKNS